MSVSEVQKCNGCKDRFGMVEKVLMRVGFYGVALIGAWSIAAKSLLWAAVYLGVSAAGLLLVMYRFLCRYCPYPHQYKTCLFFPYQWIAGVVKRPEGRIGKGEKIGLVAVMALLVFFPQPWLLAEPVLLALFWPAAGLMAAVFPLYYCRRCRHRRCAFNRVGV